MSSLSIKPFLKDKFMRVVVQSCLGILFFCSTAWAVETVSEPVAAAPVTAPLNANTANRPAAMAVAATVAPTGQPQEVRPLTAEQLAKNKALQDAKIKTLIKDQGIRLQQLEKANLDALAQNQELQLKNDSLAVQVQVLQSERSAQMFLYGAATLAVGVLMGFLIASYVYTKRRRQW
jgi:hypothetical protein